MKKPLVLALLSGFVLVGAAYPEAPTPAGAATAQAPAASYRPCRRGDPSDDRCIQLYERSVRASYARWQAAHGGERVEAAAAEPQRERPARRTHQLAANERCATDSPSHARHRDETESDVRGM
ncbi:hypothetical protein RCO27_02780 [Sphingosinicella sp. LHD-64]|uniref:hypothetical protein n=1 Tax=Sphingosinicella sp. LHD-64 TaxID=3072139 RepID=UPI00280D887A|nr:hypothetical protein [Sphingosinicella sp. LHD-64]MDQ8755145.1 hypothetical protein [Sphingosinicella sp. LHD-64]